RRQQRLSVELTPLAARADEAVAHAAGEAGGHRAGSRDVDRHLLLGTVVDRRLVGAVVVALEGDALVLPQLLDEGHGLTQAAEALLAGRPLDAQRDLVHGLAGADTEDDPA